MRKIELIDRRTTTAGVVTRLDMLLMIDGEYQHHYISLPLSATGAEVRQWIKEYIDKNVRFRNYSDEQQALEKRAFKGGAR